MPRHATLPAIACAVALSAATGLLVLALGTAHNEATAPASAGNKPETLTGQELARAASDPLRVSPDATGAPNPDRVRPEDLYSKQFVSGSLVSVTDDTLVLAPEGGGASMTFDVTEALSSWNPHKVDVDALTPGAELTLTYFDMDLPSGRLLWCSDIVLSDG